MSFIEFYEKSYGINRYEIWYRGRLNVVKCLTDIPNQLLNKTIKEFDFEEDGGRICCAIELVD